ncbi:hypothetical protein [Kutzneria sp. NPDC051319]|uniref:hypothetical protein n=1 Tax=Kutzneria sp. NPDC051319 TaxID=3155047 RepID=UPI003448B49E
MTPNAEHTSDDEPTTAAGGDRRGRLFRLLHDELSRQRETAKNRGTTATDFDNSVRAAIDELRDDSGDS